MITTDVPATRALWGCAATATDQHTEVSSPLGRSPGTRHCMALAANRGSRTGDWPTEGPGPSPRGAHGHPNRLTPANGETPLMHPLPDALDYGPRALPPQPSPTDAPDAPPATQTGADPARRERYMRRSTWITCRCGARWTDLRAAHCGSCHRSFSSVALFDRHRSTAGDRGACHNPATIHTATGERVMFRRDDMWRGPELTEEQKLAAFGTRK